MNPFEMVVLIILIITVGKVFSSRRGGRKDGIINDLVKADPDSAAMREEIRTLKDRIAVLERIATDNSSAVALDREIEKLR
jgi:cation transport ATPase